MDNITLSEEDVVVDYDSPFLDLINQQVTTVFGVGGNRTVGPVTYQQLQNLIAVYTLLSGLGVIICLVCINHIDFILLLLHWLFKIIAGALGWLSRESRQTFRSVRQYIWQDVGRSIWAAWCQGSAREEDQSDSGGGNHRDNGFLGPAADGPQRDFQSHGPPAGHILRQPDHSPPPPPPPHGALPLDNPGAQGGVIQGGAAAADEYAVVESRQPLETGAIVRTKPICTALSEKSIPAALPELVVTRYFSSDPRNTSARLTQSSSNLGTIQEDTVSSPSLGSLGGRGSSGSIRRDVQFKMDP